MSLPLQMTPSKKWAQHLASYYGNVELEANSIRFCIVVIWNKNSSLVGKA